MYVDSHLHLDFPAIREQLEAVLERASAAGVTRLLNIVCAGSKEGRPAEAVAAAESDPRIQVAMGVHPHDASAATPQLERELRRWAEHPRVVGWGEIGLDFHYDNSPRRVQRDVFVRQLAAARELGQPVIIHSRDAAEETCRLLEEHFAHGRHPGGVMHCFTYDWAVAERCLGFGFHLGFGGIVTFPRSEELREVARRVPDDRFLIETDSPYLAPVPHRGKTNEPAFVVEVARKLAQVRDTAVEEIARQSTRNFERLFRA